MKSLRKIFVWIWILFLFTGNSFEMSSVKAVFDETDAVHIRAEEIEDATLAIGTHLISLHAMNDSLYSLAIQSAEESGQQKVYYKSELGNSAWYDVNGAASLEAVQPEGNAVEADVIQELFFTHHTMSDGITYDLRTGQIVSLFDIVSPYDVDALPELDSFRNQYQALEQSGADTGLLDHFLDVERSREADADMQNCDIRLARLQAFYQSLTGSGRQRSALEPVLQIMEKIDAQRRFASYTRIKTGLETLMENVSKDAELAKNSDLLEALGTCLQKLQSRLDELEGQRREEGETALSRTEYQLEQELLDALEGGNGNFVLDELTALYHVREGIQADIEQEKAFLDERLLPAAKQLYETTGDKIAENEWNYYETLRTRLDAEEQENQEVLRLQEELERIQAEKLNALDENNLEKADTLEQQFIDTAASLKSLEQNGIYGQESMTAKIEEQKESAIKLIHEKNSNVEELQICVEGLQALCAVHPEIALSALEEVSEEMDIIQSSRDGSVIYDTLIDQCNGILEAYAEQDSEWNQEEIVNILMQEIGCVITENAINGTLTEQNLALCTLALYCEQSQETEACAFLEQLASGLAAQKASGIFRILSLSQDSDSNITQEQYAPADQVAAWCSFRYVWNKNRSRAVLAKGMRYYVFTAFDDCVLREKGKTETMPVPAPFQAAVYLPESYVKQEFSCSIQTLFGTDYAVLANQSILERASEICDMNL